MPEQINRLAEIEARTAAATPGPWLRVDDQATLTRFVSSEDSTLDISFGYLGNRTQCDVAFVAHAREDIPYLLAQLHQREAEIAELQTKLAVRERQLDDMDAGVIA